jgi:nitroreductase
VTDPQLDPWAEAVDAFPLTGTPERKALAAIRYAILAPSSHNTQPWLFAVRGGRVDLYMDHSRALPVADPDDRELVLSCGAALYHLRLALAFYGVTTTVVRCPNPDEPDLLARVALTGERQPTDLERELFHQIPFRRTNRLPFEPRPLSQTLIGELEHAADAEGAWLVVVDDEEDKGWLADLIAVADRRQMTDKRFRRELSAWTRPTLSRRKDGIPGSGLGLGTVASVGAPLVIRTFDLGQGRAARDRELALGSPALGVLGTPDDSMAGLVRGGEALAHVLLLARASGVFASYLNQPIEVEDLRPDVERMVRAPGRAQLILRLGYGQPVAPTPRRPVEEVLLP